MKSGKLSATNLQMTSTIKERLIDQENPLHDGTTPSLPRKTSTRGKGGYERANSTRSERVFTRSWTDTLAFPRSMTEMTSTFLDFESEQAFLRKLVDGDI